MSAAQPRKRRPDGQKALPPELPPTPPDSEDSASEQQHLSREQSASPAPDDPPPSYPLPPRSAAPTAVLDQDKKTPDAWLPRDPRLIRLTGAHPFNVEAPLTELFNEGFLTSPELFYVRNHGPVPQVPDAEVLDWSFSVEGLVDEPFPLTLRDLLDRYEQRTYPVTLVCAGNRRKEQNVVRKTNGFSWGAAGVSNALWTGVPLGDLLRRARPRRGARYVCMEGADKLPNGYYGTSVKLNWALDPNRGMMLAHGMNGEPLRPDHGKPLRAVIPGQIGGRSVKWLKKLIVTGEPSDNWYHIYDNRVLPTMVSPEEAKKNPTWWTDERYAIYDLSPNSAIAFPAHDERVPLPPTEPEVRDGPTYPVRGYAYSGGGRRITRVEVTLDQGATWRLAEIDYPEDAYRRAGVQALCGGTLDLEQQEASFAWCFWRLDIAVAELAAARDLFARCMDESMNVQPRDLYWSVLGMMNNPWFRIVIHRESEGGELRFEHPTQPALIPGGWMERVKKAGGDLTNGRWGERAAGDEASDRPKQAEVAEIIMTREDVTRSISLDELRGHDTAESPWFAVNGDVFDGKAFLEGHPGGASSIVAAAGTDATEEFMAIHSETAKGMMPKYHIGRLDDASKKALTAATEDSDSDACAPTGPPPAQFLDPKRWRKAVLESKRAVSPDTFVFTFALDGAEQPFGLPVGQHTMLRVRSGGGGAARPGPTPPRTSVIRAYTPISEAGRRGRVDVLAKLYLGGGPMSAALDALALGARVAFKGPTGRFVYEGRGRCRVGGARPRAVASFVMVCAGSGVTPIYQVFRAVRRDVGDRTRCVVLDGNRREADVLLREEFEALRAGREGEEERAAVVVHTLSQPGDGWTGRRGRIAAPLLEEFASPADHPEAMVLLCGPPAMEKSAKEALLALGWREEDLLFF